MCKKKEQENENQDNNNFNGKTKIKGNINSEYFTPFPITNPKKFYKLFEDSLQSFYAENNFDLIFWM